MQDLSHLPINAALAVFDWNIARQTGVKRVNWEPASVRTQLLAAARDGRIETGIAKRIISDAQAPHNRKMMPTPGADTIKEQWNALKTVEESSGSDRPSLSDPERSVVEDILRVARADDQSGMTIEGSEVEALSGVLRRVLGRGSTIASDVHHMTDASRSMGATLEGDEVRMLASILVYA